MDGSDPGFGVVVALGNTASDIVNSGTIRSNGGSNVAIEFQQFSTLAIDDRLELQSGSVIIGEVRGGPGTDTLAFGGDTGTLTFDISTVDGDNTNNGE